MRSRRACKCRQATAVPKEVRGVDVVENPCEASCSERAFRLKSVLGGFLE